MHYLSSFQAVRERCHALLPTCHHIRSYLLTSPSHASDLLLPVSAALLRSLRQSEASLQYIQYVASLPLSLCVENVRYPNDPSPDTLLPLTPDAFIAACGLSTTSTRRRPRAGEEDEAEAAEEEDEEGEGDEEVEYEEFDDDQDGEEGWAMNHRKKDKFDYGAPLVLTSLSPLLRSALRGLCQLVLKSVSLPLSDLSLLLSGAPRLRIFTCNNVQHVSPAALLLLARCCPHVEHVSLTNHYSTVLCMMEDQLDAAEDQLELLDPPPPPPPELAFTSLQSLEVRLAGYETDVDEGGFALLAQLLSDAPLQWFTFHTLAGLPATSFSLLSCFSALRGLDLTCCCRPAVYKLLYGAEHEGAAGMPWDMRDDVPEVVSLYTEPVDQKDGDHTAHCTRRFLSSAARSAFFDAVAELPPTPDDRVAFVKARETDVDVWPKAEIDFLLVELPRERRRRFFYGGECEAFDSEDE